MHRCSMLMKVPETRKRCNNKVHYMCKILRITDRGMEYHSLRDSYIVTEGTIICALRHQFCNPLGVTVIGD